MCRDRPDPASGIRVGKKGEGAFPDVSWDEALARVAEEADRGARSLRRRSDRFLFVRRVNGYLSRGHDGRAPVPSPRRLRLARTICAAPTGRAAQGTLRKDAAGRLLRGLPGGEPDRPLGVNPVRHRHSRTVPRIYEAQRRGGARLVVVDPRADAARAQGGCSTLPVRPGSDLGWPSRLSTGSSRRAGPTPDSLDTHATGATIPFAPKRARPWTMRRAADAAGVAPEDLEKRFSEELCAEARPAVVRCGWGLERNRHGGSRGRRHPRAPCRRRKVRRARAAATR